MARSAPKGKKKPARAKKRIPKFPPARRRAPIKHWSHSSLMAFLRNPLAWYKRYVEDVRDMPSTPTSFIGRAGHLALQHFYSGVPKETSVALGAEYLRGVSDLEVDFGKAKSKRAKYLKRAAMQKEYLQAVSFYLEKPPRHKVVGVEVKSEVKLEEFPLPLKAISDLVVESRVEPGALDIVDHKFVTAFSKGPEWKPVFLIQALFNYYTVRELYGKPVRRFIVYECKRTKNASGKSQLRRHVIDYRECGEEFAVFRRLINDATVEIMRRRVYLPNPSDMFEGDNSFAIYRLGLVGEGEEPLEEEP